MTVKASAARRSLLHALVACCLVSAGGCKIIRDPTAIDVDDGPIAVHAMLVAGERRIAVLVTRYESVDTVSNPFSSAYRLVPVAGADVRVTSARWSLTLHSTTDEECIVESDWIFTELQDSLAPGCYTGTVEDPIAPGAQYELSISLPARWSRAKPKCRRRS